MIKLNPAVMHRCIAQLGPLTTSDMARLWWPMAARRTVQSYLAQYVAAGTLIAHRQSRADGAVVRRMDTVYTIDGIVPPTVRPLGFAVHQILAALQTAAPTRWAACAALNPPQRGRVLLTGTDRERPLHAPLEWADRGDWMQATAAWLVIDGTASQRLQPHRVAAPWYARRCTPTHWREPFGVPTPLVVTRTAADREAVGIIWRKAWPWTDIVISDLAALRVGWDAPVWWRWKTDRRRQISLFTNPE